MKALRQPTLDTFGLGNVIDIFKNGKLPINAETLVDEIFGDSSNRGAVVISGANQGQATGFQTGPARLLVHIPAAKNDSQDCLRG